MRSYPGVRKRQAPKGALRHVGFDLNADHELFLSQKAPSGKRCIKTDEPVEMS